jgi:hypothetical protein
MDQTFMYIEQQEVQWLLRIMTSQLYMYILRGLRIVDFYQNENNEEW